MMKKKGEIIFLAVAILFIASLFIYNRTTYHSMKKHIGYTYGTIIKIWNDDGTWYSRYQYTLNGETFQGRQGDRYKLNDTILVIYDTTKPRFSMIATYPLKLLVDSNNKIIRLDTSQVTYKWSDYLPGDKIP